MLEVFSNTLQWNVLMFLRYTHHKRFKKPSYGDKKAKTMTDQKRKKSKSSHRELNSRPKSTKSTGIALGAGARGGVFGNRPYRFSKFRRFRPRFAKFRRKIILFFLVRFDPVDAHNYTYSHSMCVQGSLKFSGWDFIFTVRKSKKTEILAIIFRFHLSSDPKFLFCKLFDTGIEISSIFWSRVKG